MSAPMLATMAILAIGVPSIVSYAVGWFRGFESCSRIHDDVRSGE